MQLTFQFVRVCVYVCEAFSCPDFDIPLYCFMIVYRTLVMLGIESAL